jgi:Yip1 domain
MSPEIIDPVSIRARPWRTIWFSPRRTMRELLASEVRPGWTLVVGLAALHGALAIMGGLAAKGALSFNAAAMPTIIGVLQVVFGVLVGPFFLAFSGGWFGGEADPEEIRQSLAWSCAPFAVTVVCWIPVLLVGGAVAPVPGDAPSASMVVKALLLLAVTLVYFAALLWTFVLQVITLAEVQHFSVLRSFGSIVVWMVPLLLVSVLR